MPNVNFGAASGASRNRGAAGADRQGRRENAARAAGRTRGRRCEAPDRAPATGAKRRERRHAERMPTHRGREPASAEGAARWRPIGRAERANRDAAGRSPRREAEAAEESEAVRGAPNDAAREPRKEHRIGWGHGARPRERREWRPLLKNSIHGGRRAAAASECEASEAAGA